MSYLTEKVNFVFDTFFDVNKDKSIQEDDFQLAIQNICKARGYSEGQQQYAKVSVAFLKVWNGLRDQADADGDNKIDRDEWANIWSGKGASADEWKAMFRDFMFKLFDADDDGSISMEEFVLIISAFGINSKEAEASFSTMTNGGQEILNREKYSQLWKEFFSSEDKNAKGNFLFGKQI